MRALFIGRFQPFHNGHLNILKKIIRNNDSLIVVVGSAQYSNLPQNPFNSGERIVMINAVLRELKVKEFYIIPIEDVGNDELWASKIEELTPEFDMVYTNNPVTKKIFSRKRYKVESPGLFVRSRFSGTRIRGLIAKGKPWKNLVPKKVADELIRIGGEERLEMLYENPNRISK